MANGKSLFLGVLVGSIIGATTTLLTTPASGETVRRQAKDQSIKLKNTIMELASNSRDIKSQLTKTTKEGAVLLRELSQDVKSSIENWRSSIEPHQQNIQEHLLNVEESLKELEDKINQKKQQKN
ncbi:YtxH domain-containing protein [Salirhabdus sp. Marseille-P4669]|uniref:YtxH domain-containing protein n=1 Tax=Salirhabdus sp. Marseille-P4669 TaxID=2042310 RepID=UPI000C7B9770|nr:YtxH domain-containing protein [Salirhabdus sp. Marseille-P4669]